MALYTVVFILGALIGQFALLAFVRVRMGHEGFGLMQDFMDAWIGGEVEMDDSDGEKEDGTNGEDDADHA